MTGWHTGTGGQGGTDWHAGTGGQGGTGGHTGIGGQGGTGGLGGTGKVCLIESDFFFLARGIGSPTSNKCVVRWVSNTSH